MAGEISTGKTTILEFIDYCLGNAAFPQHPEVIDGVKAAQLSIEVNVPVAMDRTEGESDSDLPDAARLGYGRRRFLIQRGVEGSTKDVLIFSGDLDSLDQVSPNVVSADHSAQESLSKFLLQLCGLDGIKLRVAPTRPDSATHQLSFRDTAPLWFLSNTRLDNKNLSFEHTPPKALKLRQVVDLVFEVFDAERANLAGQVAELQEELRGERKGIDALRRFIREQGVPDPVTLEGLKTESEERRRRALMELSEIDDRARERTTFAEEARHAYLGKLEEARESAGKVRERQTLLRRLAPLRSQYAEDVKKLNMLKEAKRLFDPLGVTVCPACTSHIQDVGIRNGRCSLCDSTVPHLAHHALTNGSGQQETEELDTENTSVDVDVTKELSSTKRRLRELNDYIMVVETEAKEARATNEALDEESKALQARLDSLTREAVTPLLAAREAAVKAVGDTELVRENLNNQQRMLDSVEQREQEVEALAARLGEARRRAAESEANRRDRGDMISKLSGRFHSILMSFGYPKLTEAEINGQLIPSVRGIRYDRVGSSGATTLISLAWELAIFELAYEEGRRHPGFLMIDSPQKNLAPESFLDSSGESHTEPAIVPEAIVRRIYRHLSDWLSAGGDGAQIIIVDNVPPPSVETSVVVTYSGSSLEPPYGLIDDA
ncbi:hypothetical protein [Streptomyces sp. NPDC088358]|uniref:hypothetical protein n=1 Tax=Streptomyces sp. NPDC088358 TaxID=3365857 RepID=UPI00382152B2